MTNVKPHYKHSCPSCKFITATISSSGKITDWYICTNLMESVLGRFSNVESEYWSMPSSVVASSHQTPALVYGTGEHMHSEELLLAQAVLTLAKTL